MLQKWMAHKCLECEILASLYERICFCGGPFIIFETDVDKAKALQNYERRKLLWHLRRTK